MQKGDKRNIDTYLHSIPLLPVDSFLIFSRNFLYWTRIYNIFIILFYKRGIMFYIYALQFAFLHWTINKLLCIFQAVRTSCTPNSTSTLALRKPNLHRGYLETNPRHHVISPINISVVITKRSVKDFIFKCNYKIKPEEEYGWWFGERRMMILLISISVTDIATLIRGFGI